LLQPLSGKLNPCFEFIDTGLIHGRIDREQYCACFDDHVSFGRNCRYPSTDLGRNLHDPACNRGLATLGRQGSQSGQKPNSHCDADQQDGQPGEYIPGYQLEFEDEQIDQRTIENQNNYHLVTSYGYSPDNKPMASTGRSGLGWASRGVWEPDALFAPSANPDAAVLRRRTCLKLSALRGCPNTRKGTRRFRSGRKPLAAPPPSTDIMITPPILSCDSAR